LVLHPAHITRKTGGNHKPLESAASPASSRPSTASTIDHSSDDWDDSADAGGGVRPKTATERARAKRRRDELIHGKGRRSGKAVGNERSSSAPPRRLPPGGGKSNKVGGGWARRIFSDDDEDSSSTEEETSSEEEVRVTHAAVWNRLTLHFACWDGSDRGIDKMYFACSTCSALTCRERVQG